MKPFKIIIRGENSLSGRVRISGAKNAALPGLAASLLSQDACHFSNVPQVDDIRNLLLALREVGAVFEFNGNRVSLQIPEVKSETVSSEVTHTTRASILLLGPLVARHGNARIAFPGGCSIGERKINYHLEGLERMGASIRIEGDFIIARADKLKGTEYRFPSKTVTGTENLLMTAALAEGTTILHNCALEPEIGDLAKILVKMGVEIEGIGRETMAISGKSRLCGVTHEIIPDRIEAGTYLLAGCFSGNHIELENGNPGHLDALFHVLEEIGYSVFISDGLISAQRKDTIHPLIVKTEPYPGFPTDLQAQLTTLLTQVEGESRIIETIFNDRFKHVNELNRMSASISVKGDMAFIRGKTPLLGTRIKTTDLRASAALVLAGLIAKGETVIENSFQLMRGYENMAEKLQKLGADIRIEV